MLFGRKNGRDKRREIPVQVRKTERICASSKKNCCRDRSMAWGILGVIGTRSRT
jgi:hypothetical protein